MGLIAALLPDEGQLERLRAAVGDRHEVVACDTWETLLHVAEGQPVRVAIIDLFAGGHTNFERIRHLKQRLPRVTLIAYVVFTADRAHDLFDAGRQGIDGLVLADQDDASSALLALVDRAESRSLGAIVRDALDDVDSVTRDAVLVSVTRAHEGLSPDQLARRLGLPRRTVSQRLAKAGFPAPRRLLTWGRLIFAAHLLEDRHRSADRIAEALEFPSGSAFRNACQRYLGLTPQEIRSRGGAAHVLAALLREVRPTKSPGAHGRGRGTPLASEDPSEIDHARRS